MSEEIDLSDLHWDESDCDGHDDESSCWETEVISALTEQANKGRKVAGGGRSESPEKLAGEQMEKIAKETLKLDSKCSPKDLENEINKLIGSLASDEGSVRNAAFAKLEKVGGAAIEQLAKVYLTTADPQLFRSTQALLRPLVHCFPEGREQYLALHGVESRWTNYPAVRKELGKILDGVTGIAKVSDSFEEGRHSLASRSIQKMASQLLNMTKEVSLDTAKSRLHQLQQPLRESKAAKEKLEDLFVKSSLTLASKLESNSSTLMPDGKLELEQANHPKARRVLCKALEARPSLGTDEKFLSLAAKVLADTDKDFMKVFTRITGKEALRK
ncbi:MAG: hypothetical protein K2W95_33605 [Candidatus Obscuribacterales bacterium]|nr:hypothetical protein [Candidatus Obscuribacterales bacterium]